MDKSAQDFLTSSRAAKAELIRQGASCGPQYSRHGSAPLAWNDQFFGRGLAPAGEVECPAALRVGATLSSLDIILLASHANEEDLQIAAGAAITLTLQQADSFDGEFEDVGPTVCVKAPSEGMTVCPCDRLFRFPIGDFKKPWLKAKLEFSGAITGGTVDCALGYIPR